MLNNLDFVAITDHNSTKQLKVINELKDSYDFTVIPGVEVSVLEKFDVLCYFRSFDDAINFDQFLEDNLGNDWNNFTEENQVITDIYDTQIETFPRPLTTTTISYENLYNEVRKYKGAIVLAHIDRKSCSALNSFTLKNIDFDGIEIQPYRKDEYLENNQYLLEYKILHNSDSHSLLSISDQEFSFDLEDKSIDAFFKYLVGDKYE